MAQRLTALVSGDVQGVGFRAWVRRRAVRSGLTGSARNIADGRVEVIAEGPRDALESLLAHLHAGAAPGAVSSVDASWDEAQGTSGFRLG